MKDTLKIYSKTEERLNVMTHFIGMVFSLIALILMLNKVISLHDSIKIIAVVIYGVSLLILYTASTLYHNAKKAKKRRILNIFDHAAIFVLIAGTYTPFALITLKGFWGWLLFILVWLIAIAGIVFKLFFTGKYDKLSTALYIAMGWIVVFFIKPLLAALPLQGFYWLAAGGLFYTIGAVFYSISKIKYNHAIFHIWVLLGSWAQFMAIYFYVL